MKPQNLVRMPNSSQFFRRFSCSVLYSLNLQTIVNLAFSSQRSKFILFNVPFIDQITQFTLSSHLYATAFIQKDCGQINLVRMYNACFYGLCQNLFLIINMHYAYLYLSVRAT